MTRRVTAVMTLLAGAAVAAQSPAAIRRARLPVAADVAVPAGGMSVPMTDAGGRPVVEVAINGRGPFRMILDTGASVNVLAGDLVTELGLGESGVTAGPVRVGSLRVGEAVIRDVDVARGGNLLAALGPDAPRGVLSALTFPGALLVIDYPRRRVEVRAGSLPTPDGDQVFDYPTDDPLPSLPIRVGSLDTRLTVDTGSPLAISLRRDAAAKLGLDDKLVQTGTARLATGEFPLFTAPFNQPVAIGRHAVSLTELNVSDARAGPREPRGHLGAALLRSFVLTIDAANRRIRLERPQ